MYCEIPAVVGPLLSELEALKGRNVWVAVTFGLQKYAKKRFHKKRLKRWQK